MRLKELRKQKKLTQDQLAEKLFMTQHGYSSYECGRTEPNIETLCKLADFYNVSLDYLVGREFVNDLGYLSNKQKSIVRILKNVDEKHLDNILEYISKLLDE